VESGVITYIYDKSYSSRMIVEYSIMGRKTRRIAEGSRSNVTIPKHSTRIKVRFQNIGFVR
jgi:hypothetical protein